MKSRLLFWASGALVLIGTVLLLIYSDSSSDIPPAAQPPASTDYRVVFKNCWFNVPWQENIRCAELHTAASTGGFVLPVVIIKDNSNAKKTDAVFYLQGGPGSSANLDNDGITYWLRWRDTMELGRDLVLMDPRGTGRSRPALQCPAYDELSRTILKRNVNLHEELREGYAVLEQCFASLRQAQQPFNPEDYGTQRHAQDVRALMALLPYDQWNLLGVSYGTRVAMETAKQPSVDGVSQIRSLILDSVYPPGRGGVTSFPAVLDLAFRNFFQWCAETETCRTHQPIEQALDAALKQLHKTPITLTIPRRDGEVPVDIVVNDHRFISAVFSALYSKHQWHRIPAAITAVQGGDQRALLSLMEPFVHSALSEDFYSLVFMAVDCRDHGISAREDYQQELEKYPRWQKYTQDLWQYQACHIISAAKAVSASPTVLPEVPVLILAGALDPITPVEWAEFLHQEWPGSHLHIVPDAGHAIINSDDCIYQSLRSFLDEPTESIEVCGE